MWPLSASVPEVLDFVRESSTAQAIRLLNDYGRLAKGLPGSAEMSLGANLVEAARFASRRYGALSEALAHFGSGYFCSALQVADDAHAMVVGPRAREDADRLYRLVPTRLAAPAIGAVRRDLQAKPEGVYVARGASTIGPMSVEQAARAIGATLRAP
jgi:hypothetical protein